MEQEWDGERWNKESGGGEKITCKERERSRFVKIGNIKRKKSFIWMF